MGTDLRDCFSIAEWDNMAGVANTINTRPLQAAIRQGVKNELLALGLQMQGRIQIQIRDKGAIASGTLFGSIESTISETPEGVSLRVGSAMSGGKEDYSKYSEHGTRAHWPPIDPIKQWVEFKKSSFTTAVFSDVQSRRQKTRRLISRSKEASQLSRIAYAIQAAIAKRGTRARYYMRDALIQMSLRFSVTQDFDYAIDADDYLQKNGPSLWQKIVGGLPKK
jgi:hypothetical protein